MCLETTSSGIESKLDYVVNILERVEEKLDEILIFINESKINGNMNKKVTLWLKNTSRVSQERKQRQ